MTQKQLTEIAVFAITKNFPDQIANAEPEGRLKGMYRKLDQEVIRLLGECPSLNEKDEAKLNDLLTTWAKLTRWCEKGKTQPTVVCFLIGIISDNLKHCGKLLIILQSIWNHFERAKKIPIPSEWAGMLAAERFNNIF